MDTGESPGCEARCGGRVVAAREDITGERRVDMLPRLPLPGYHNTHTRLHFVAFSFRQRHPGFTHDKRLNKPRFNLHAR